MICEIMIYSSTSLSVVKLTFLLLLNILYLFRNILYKWIVLFLFKRCKYGNISIIERSALLKPDLSLEQVEKNVLNVVNHSDDPSVVMYVTNEKFYENFLFYNEKGLKKSFGIDFHTVHLYELFEIIYAPPTSEWIFYKKFVNAYNKHTLTEAKNIMYEDEEFLFSVDDKTDYSLEEIKIVIHNGNFDFKNTSLSNCMILTDQEISKKIIYKRVERFLPTVFSDDYGGTFMKFLFQKNYLSYNYYFKV